MQPQARHPETSMPTVLQTFLAGLSQRDGDLLAEWVDEATQPAVEIVAAILRSRGGG